ncbi:P-loop containing nucleoside triphosphate hydrolase protein [Lasiosphaeria hispida]|uniref:P-loop containing nucleoside triphosphate hydrolase protein n=1 Tax=Lasiosphaeria hispida TaxID=260671 RepID=A0AAJ0H723_9PEZI|nr:P-loop containing nucleoside triphosphate hydrolase protein [Lasiosphaeria hispida]
MNEEEAKGEDKAKEDEPEFPNEDELPEPPPKHNPFSEKSDDVNVLPEIKAPDAECASESSASSLNEDEKDIKGKKKSQAEAEWTRQKSELGAKSEALDKLMSLVGLEEVKTEFLKVKGTVETARQRKGQLKRQDLNLVLLGNAGTGKRTIAGLYRDFLRELDVWPGVHHSSSTALNYTGYWFHHNNAVSNFEDKIKKSNFCNGGIVFIDAIDGMDREYAAELLECMESHSENIVFVVAGSGKKAMKFLGSRPHGKWFFRRRLTIKDYTEEELRQILARLIYHNALDPEGGYDGPFVKIAAKRVARDRDTPGFGNVYDLISALNRMLDRQAARIGETPKTVIQEPGPEVLRVLTMEDIIGPEPKDIRSESEAWKELEEMVGLDDVKKAIGALLDRAKANYRREILGKEPLTTSLNRVFMGPPGTGKTTVAKLYGQVLAEIGLLSTKEVVVTTPGDFIGQYIGQSEVKTGQILDATVGKVLIIDDAHMFYVGGRPGSGGHESDIFRLACIDTLISRIHNKPGEDRCVILLGYTEHLEEMFQKVNPGLLRRFPLEEAFRFTDYDDKRLNDILKLKMAKEEITADEAAMEVAAEVLRRARDRPNFGNGGDVDNLLTQAKTRFRERTQPKEQGTGESTRFTADFEVRDSIDEAIPIALDRKDFDPEWDRGSKASRKCRQLFDGLIGFDGVIDKFQGYQRIAANLQRRGKNPKLVIPFNFLFKGPPGTGKTHTARIIGQVFYDMGFLSTNEVIECSASQLIGQYLGHTAPKVVNLFERALGKVLFIDEAYRLGAGSKGTSCGSFEEEAIGEIVDCMTKTRYMRKMVIVLAGYDHDMEALMKVNPGLRGRFPTEIDFPPMSASRCRTLLVNQLQKEDIVLRDLIEPSRDEKERVLRLFDKLSMSPGWANARDIKTLADQIMGHVYQKGADEEEGAEVETQFRISTPELIGHLRAMLQQRVKG